MARLLLRTVLGGTMIAHGLKHGRSLDGTAGWFGSIGFKEPQLQARASAIVETGAGAALIAGAGTPLAAAAVVGTMGVAARSVHQPNGFFITAEGYEYVLNLAAASVALAGLGPGRRVLVQAGQGVARPLSRSDGRPVDRDPAAVPPSPREWRPGGADLVPGGISVPTRAPVTANPARTANAQV
ncbi:MAG TPA: DoxX family protein [Pseudonocardia sp.]|nr:DoxX family protein [Pseudonocardia sp.]